MVDVRYSSPEPSAGASSDMRVLPHLMSPEAMNDMSTIVRIDESGNQWSKESGQIDVRPADELVDPGPRGRFEPTPATSAEIALDVCRALIIDAEHDKALARRKALATRCKALARRRTLTLPTTLPLPLTIISLSLSPWGSMRMLSLPMTLTGPMLLISVTTSSR